MFDFNFISTIFFITELIAAILSVVFFLAGFKLIRVAHLVITAYVGFMLGFLIGYVLNIEIFSYLFGVGLALVFSYFCFMYHKYLKGLTLGILSFALFTSLALLMTDMFLVSFAIGLVITMLIVILNYLFERITTVIFTGFLGTFLILEIVLDLDLDSLMLIGLILIGTAISFALQFLVLRKWPNYI